MGTMKPARFCAQNRREHHEAGALLCTKPLNSMHRDAHRDPQDYGKEVHAAALINDASTG
jgi:hypothetical protein